MTVSTIMLLMLPVSRQMHPAARQVGRNACVGWMDSRCTGCRLARIVAGALRADYDVRG
jgi:hypothetical protein